MSNIGSIITAVVLTVGGNSSDSLQTDFEAMGFSVTKSDPLTLLVIGEKSLFEKQFGIAINEQREADRVTGIFVNSTDELSNEQQNSAIWPALQIPAKYRDMIKSIEFEQPISFGPMDY